MRRGTVASLAPLPPPRSHFKFYVVEFFEDGYTYVSEVTFSEGQAKEEESRLRSLGKQVVLWSDYYDIYYIINLAGAEILWQCDTGEMFNWNVIGFHLWLRKAFDEYQKVGRYKNAG